MTPLSLIEALSIYQKRFNLQTGDHAPLSEAWATAMRRHLQKILNQRTMQDKVEAARLDRDDAIQLVFAALLERNVPYAFDGTSEGEAFRYMARVCWSLLNGVQRRKSTELWRHVNAPHRATPQQEVDRALTHDVQAHQELLEEERDRHQLVQEHRESYGRRLHDEILPELVHPARLEEHRQRLTRLISCTYLAGGVKRWVEESLPEQASMEERKRLEDAYNQQHKRLRELLSGWYERLDTPPEETPEWAEHVRLGAYLEELGVKCERKVS